MRGSAPSAGRLAYDYYTTTYAELVADAVAAVDLLRQRQDVDPAKIGLFGVSESYIADISYDPTPYLERLSTPMLYLYGTEDVNVLTEACVARLTKLADDGKPVSFHGYEGGA